MEDKCCKDFVNLTKYKKRNFQQYLKPSI